MNKRSKLGFFLFGVILVLAVAAMDGKTDEDLAQEEYCEMVTMWRASGGDTGWPDFNQTYDSECTHDTSSR